MAGKAAAGLDDRYSTSERFVTLRGLEAEARRRLSQSDWTYLHCGTGDEVTARDNVAAFDRHRFHAPLFTGVAPPDTSTSVLGHDLSFPAFTAPFGGGEIRFDPEGMCAVGRAAEAAGIKQMVPVAAGHSLEEVAHSSSAAAIFQMTFVGEEDQVLAMIERAKAAGYTHVCVTFSPIRQWRERMMEDRFRLPSASSRANFGPDRSDPAMLQELLEFTQRRWDWPRAAQVIKASPLPCIIKGVTDRRDVAAALEAGAAGLYVSNYGGRTLDREPATLDVLPQVRAEAGPAVPIIFDSGIRRGSDIATALALGANAVALGRTCALGLAAAGELGVRRTLELLKDEFWTTMGHLGCSTVGQINTSCLAKT